jgi:hypothetical protein
MNNSGIKVSSKNQTQTKVSILRRNQHLLERTHLILTLIKMMAMMIVLSKNRLKARRHQKRRVKLNKMRMRMMKKTKN